MTKLINNSKLILLKFAACMLCWGNILPSSQHFLSTSNILILNSFLILNYFKIPLFWQEAPLVWAYSPVALFPLKINAQGVPSLYNLVRELTQRLIPKITVN